MIPVVLITGFLGSGKTTLLKRIAEQHRDRRWVYLVNDFASVDVDGEWIKQADDRVVSISGGSIFCTCLVTDFIRTLKTIAEDRTFMSEPPEALIIEASGMTDPRVIRHMLKETRWDQVYEVRRVLALADPGTFHKLLKTLPNLRSQIEAADTVLISKSDRYSPEEQAAVEEAVHRIQPEALCVRMVMGEIDFDIMAPVDAPTVKGDYAKCVDPNYHRFVMTDLLPTLAQLRGLIAQTAEALYRAKGFIEEEGILYAVDYSSSGLQIEPWRGAPVSPRLVCIGRGTGGEALERAWQKVIHEKKPYNLNPETGSSPP